MWLRVRTLTCGLAMAFGLGLGPDARADELSDPEPGEMPPRLSLVDGQVSFWRPGAAEWTVAQVNTPLAPGDVLATGSPGALEIQIGASAFARAWASTQLGLAGQEPDFIRFTLTGGSVVFDLRALEPDRVVEVDTPNAAVTVQQAGIYRVDVFGERTRVVARRGGRALVTPASGQPVTVTPSAEVVIDGVDSSRLALQAPAPPDDWDRWSDARTDRLLTAASARYVPAGTYGLTDLDAYGVWRTVPTYGTVWVPTGVPVGWAPYSTGSWIIDPVYGWTWVDSAPWGWAPYHHGRWCFVNGGWAWAPGPLIARPVYAPALVAFFDQPGPGGVIGPTGPAVGWVALGWGEPVVPWWGRLGAHRGPSWRGWGGPRVVNNVVVHHTTVVSAHHITTYRNASIPRAVMAVDRARFGHGPTAAARVLHVDAQRLRPVHGAPSVSTAPASFAPTVVRGVRPPEPTPRLVTAPKPPPRTHAVDPTSEKEPARQTPSRSVGPSRPTARPASPPGSPGSGPGGAPSIITPGVSPSPGVRPGASLRDPTKEPRGRAADRPREAPRPTPARDVDRPVPGGYAGGAPERGGRRPEAARDVDRPKATKGEGVPVPAGYAGGAPERGGRRPEPAPPGKPATRVLPGRLLPVMPSAGDARD